MPYTLHAPGPASRYRQNTMNSGVTHAKTVFAPKRSMLHDTAAARPGREMRAAAGCPESPAIYAAAPVQDIIGRSPGVNAIQSDARQTKGRPSHYAAETPVPWNR